MAVAISACGTPTGLTVEVADPLIPADRLELIEGEITRAFEMSVPLIDVDGVAVVIRGPEARVIPGRGVGGIALDDDLVAIAVDPRVSEAVIRERLGPLVAHESHHVPATVVQETDRRWATPSSSRASPTTSPSNCLEPSRHPGRWPSTRTRSTDSWSKHPRCSTPSISTTTAGSSGPHRLRTGPATRSV